MAFATPEPILQAIRDRLDRKILGYTKIYDEEYYEIFGSWCERQYGHRFKTEDIVLSPGIIPALNRLVPLLTDMDDSILIMTPSYGPFKKAGEYSQRRVVYSALKKSAGGWEPDWEDFARKASQARDNRERLPPPCQQVGSCPQYHRLKQQDFFIFLFFFL